jgi:flagellar hook-associated protein 1 FlgK
VLRQANGDALAVAGGLVLPLRAASGPFTLSAATLAPDTPAAAVPRLSLDGVPVMGEPIGGRIGANLALRDTTLPDLQSGLDQFAQSMASRFDLQGLTLFTDATGAIPTIATAGSAQGLRVNAAVVATPTMLRDGAGPAGAAGATTLIDNVLDRVLGSGTGSLATAASALASKHAVLAAGAAGELATGQAVQSSLDAKLAAGTGVSLDTETADLVRLQNAYAANAKVITAAQAMWTQLLDSVR